MSRERQLLSLLIAYHLAAVTFAALPAPRDLNPVQDIRHPEQGVSAWLAPAFDGLATWLSKIQPALFRASEPVRLVTRPYVDAGLRQKWNMFSNPGTDDQYLRVDVVVGRAAGDGGSAGGRPVAHQELVFPADDESRPRWVHQFRDKAIFNALENYFLRLRREDDYQAPDASRVQDLRPVARHFTNAFLRTHPRHAARLLRTELWHGTAPNPPPGNALASTILRARLLRLEQYRREVAASTAVAAPVVGRREREADLVWTLVHVQDGQP